MEILISRGERQYGPYSEAQVRQMLHDGSVTLLDQASVGGAGWAPLSEIPAFVGEGAGDSIQVTAADLIPVPPPVVLWNPNHAASVAVLSLGILGPLIHAFNWKTLGRTDRQMSALGWAGAFLAAYVLIFLFGDWITSDDGQSYGVAIMVGLLVCWWFGPGKEQVKFVKGLPAGKVSFRSSRPLVFGSLALLGGMLAVFLPLVERDQLEQTAMQLINERLQDRLGEDSLECVDLQLGKKLAKDLWQAEGLLDNGTRLGMTVRRMEGGVVAVRVNPASFLPLGLSE